MHFAGPSAQQHRHPVPQPSLRGPGSGLPLQGVHHDRPRRRDRRGARAGHSRMLGVDAVQGRRPRSRRHRGAVRCQIAVGQHDRQRRRQAHRVEYRLPCGATTHRRPSTRSRPDGGDPRQRRDGQRGRSGVRRQRLRLRYRRRPQQTCRTGAGRSARLRVRRRQLRALSTRRRDPDQRHADRHGRGQ